MNREQDRLKQLRDRQLTDRDPLVKQRKFQQSSAQKEKRVRARGYSLREAWLTIPAIYRSPMIGLLLGLGVMFVLPYFWDSSWAFWVGLGAVFFFILIGILTGRAQDIRDNLKDAIKH